jgi:uncharacterized membrane protein
VKNRLYFIDIVRAFAILMMLQGHFIDTLLDNSYRNLDADIYKTWSFFRGITAPIFFTISGLIFSYLLLKSSEKGEQNARLKKGIVRGTYLIAIGYFLRISFPNWFSGVVSSSLYAVDVLHCIGMSLIVTVCIFFVCNKKTLLFSIIMLLMGMFIFVLEPLYRSLNIADVPLLIHNYISKKNGSVFNIIPWYGFTSFGSFIATLFYWNIDKKHFKTITISSFICIGLILILYSSDILLMGYNITKIAVWKDAANYNYLFSKLGYVLLYFAFFYGLERYLKHPFILRIGKKTLSLYVIHFIILYGSFFDIGLKKIGKTLTPIPVAIGAFLFILLTIFVSFNYPKAKLIAKNKSRSILEILRIASIKKSETY